ncbi:hypothetical protein [Caulobacter sp. RHG1]|uniref:hypothetical protein n=1 Tax=Caulobacter sp. (strain RHG1) TaxID=2545762 RepID=UPI001552CA2E|nr:hypothetical protein [Caulobacter sp. RHG1]NQE61608.1 hypothetical protein [Caulobacter sp. RHG1]
MLDAKLVIAGALVALVVIYFLPRIDTVVRKIYGRYRRKKRDLRQQKEREEQLARRTQS